MGLYLPRPALNHRTDSIVAAAGSPGDFVAEPFAFAVGPDVPTSIGPGMVCDLRNRLHGDWIIVDRAAAGAAGVRATDLDGIVRGAGRRKIGAMELLHAGGSFGHPGNRGGALRPVHCGR